MITPVIAVSTVLNIQDRVLGLTRSATARISPHDVAVRCYALERFLNFKTTSICPANLLDPSSSDDLAFKDQAGNARYIQMLDPRHHSRNRLTIPLSLIERIIPSSKDGCRKRNKICLHLQLVQGLRNEFR